MRTWAERVTDVPPRNLRPALKRRQSHLSYPVRLALPLLRHILFRPNDPIAEGAYTAAHAAGEDLKKILFVGIDAPPTPGGIMSVLQGRTGVTFIYPTGGKQAINWGPLILTKAVVLPL